MLQKTFESYILLFAIPIIFGFLIGSAFVFINYRRSVIIHKKQKNHFLFIIENEKIKISRELHDAIAPFTLPLKEFIKKRGCISIEEEKVWLNEINRFEDYLTKINEKIFPSELLDGNLKVALQVMTQKLCTKNRKIILHTEFSTKISNQHSIQIFRIIQESLINAIKYSQSPFYNLLFTQNELDLICTVNYEIDAKNNTDHNDNSHRRGRKIMSQRLELLSGKYDLSVDQNIKTEKFIFKDIFK
jgi:signal transduction histidine kinase